MLSWTTEELFEKLQHLEDDINKVPERSDVKRRCSSTQPKTKDKKGFPVCDTFIRRLGEGRNWADVKRKYKSWKEDGKINERDKKESRSLAREIRDKNS